MAQRAEIGIFGGSGFYSFLEGMEEIRVHTPYGAPSDKVTAARLWPDADPIGKRLKQGWPEDKTPWREVIGVVADVKLNGVNRDTPARDY